MKKKKVLLIAFNNLGKGGIQNQLMNIIRTLKDRVDFDVVVWDQVKDFYTPELEQYNIKIHKCFRNTGKTLLRQKADVFIRYGDIKKRIAQIIAEHGPYDAIHCNNAYDAAPCLDAACKAGIPVRISHAHNMENPSLKKKATYFAYRVHYAHHRRLIRKFATHMIGCSRQVADYFFGTGVGQVVHIGIELADFTQLPLKQATNAPFELLHVGSMCEQKNQLFLVEVMDALAKSVQNVHLTMIGGGTQYLEEVKKRISAKKLESYIRILPPQASVADAMAKADLFVFPSTFEGFGIVLIEAQAAGRPCLVSQVVSPEANCGGLQYLPLQSGPEGWANAILQATASGCCQKKYDVAHFSVENMATTIATIYGSLS